MQTYREISTSYRHAERSQHQTYIRHTERSQHRAHMQRDLNIIRRTKTQLLDHHLLPLRRRIQKQNWDSNLGTLIWLAGVPGNASPYVSFFLIKFAHLFTYILKRQTEREQECKREIFHPLVQSPDVQNSRLVEKQK